MRRYVAAFWGVAGLICGAVARGADPVVPTLWPVAEAKAYLEVTAQPISAKAAAFVERLRSGNFAEREAASKELTEKGAAEWPGLWEAVEKSGDPEVQARVRPYFFIENFRLSPRLPIGFAPALRRYVATKIQAAVSPRAPSFSPSTDLRTDEQQGVLCELILSRDKDALAEQILAGNQAIRARLAIVQGRFDDAKELLRRQTAKDYLGAADYAAFVALRAGDAFDPLKEFEQANLLEASRRDELGMMLFRAKGDLKKAAEFAMQMPRPTAGQAVRPALLEARQFKELAPDINAGSRPDTDNFYDAIAHELAGEEEESRRILARQLRKIADAKRSVSQPILATLIRAGEIEAVIAATRENPEDRWVAEDLLCRQLRIDDAARLLQADRHPPMLVIEQLIDQGFTGTARTILLGIVPDEAALKDVAEYESDLAALLDRVGERATAEKWRRQAATHVDRYRAALAEVEKKRGEMNARLRALQSIPPAQRTAEHSADLREAEAALRKAPDGRSLYTSRFSVRYYPRTTGASIQEASMWMDNGSFHMVPAGTTTLERFRVMREIFEGTYSGDELMRYMTVDPKSPVIEMLLRIGTRSLQRVHREDLAERLLEQVFAVTKDPDSFSILGDWALQSGHLEKAVEWYKRASVFRLTDATLMYRMGLAYTQMPGKKAEGEKLKAFVPWLVLGDAKQAEAVAQAMLSFGQKEDAEKWEGYMDRFGKYGAREQAGPHMARQRDTASQREDYVTALLFAERKLFTPPYGYSREDDYVVSAMEDRAAYQRIRALDAWTRKDFAVVAEALLKELENGPPDVEVLVKVYPPLKAADPGAAERVLVPVLDRLRPVVAAYPEIETYKKQLQRAEALRQAK